MDLLILNKNIYNNITILILIMNSQLGGWKGHLKGDVVFIERSTFMNDPPKLNYRSLGKA